MQLPSFRLPDKRVFGGIAIGVLIGVLIGVIGVGAVTAASPTPSGPSGASGAPAAAGAAANPGLKLGALRQAIGRNFRVAVDATSARGTNHLLYVRGAIDVSAGSVTVTLPDNSTQTFTVDVTTKVRDAGKTVPFSDLNDDERAMVFGSRNDDGSYTAKLIRCVKEPKAAAPAAASATP